MADVIMNGTSLLLYRRSGTVGSYTYKAVGHAISNSLTINMATRETSNKDTGIYTCREAGRLDVVGSAEGLSVYDDGFGLEDMQLAITERTPLYMLFAEVTVGEDPENETPDLDKPYGEGTFVLTSVEQTNPDQENSTYSISFEGIGDFEITEPE
jgi:hypothetical protein